MIALIQSHQSQLDPALFPVFDTISSQEKIAKDVKEQEFKKTRADILSRNRQEWINTLRNELSGLVSSAHKLADNQALLVSFSMGGAEAAIKNIQTAQQLQSEISSERGVFYRHKSKIELLLNPNERDSVKMMKILSELTSRVMDLTTLNVVSATEPLVELGQVILKTEWDRVKLLEGYD